MQHPRFSLGVDSGGTFTDFALMNTNSGYLVDFKPHVHVPANDGALLRDGRRA